MFSQFAFQFVCDTMDLNNVKKGLEAQGIEVMSARLGYLPTSYVEVAEDLLDQLMPMYDKLDNIEEFVRVYDNFKVAS